MKHEPVAIGDIALIFEADRLIVSINTQESWASWSVEETWWAIQVLQAWMAEQEGRPCVADTRRCDLCLRDTGSYPELILGRDGESWLCTDCRDYTRTAWEADPTQRPVLGPTGPAEEGEVRQRGGSQA